MTSLGRQGVGRGVCRGATPHRSPRSPRSRRHSTRRRPVASRLRRPRQPAVLEREARRVSRTRSRRSIAERSRRGRQATPGGRISVVSSRTRSRRAPATSSSASPTVSNRFCGPSRTTARRTSSPTVRAGHAITSLDAPELKTLRIGVYANTPVEESLARRGLVDHLTAYSLFFDPQRRSRSAGASCSTIWSPAPSTWRFRGVRWPGTTSRS